MGGTPPFQVILPVKCINKGCVARFNIDDDYEFYRITKDEPDAGVEKEIDVYILAELSIPDCVYCRGDKSDWMKRVRTKMSEELERLGLDKAKRGSLLRPSSSVNAAGRPVTRNSEDSKLEDGIKRLEEGMKRLEESMKRLEEGMKRLEQRIKREVPSGQSRRRPRPQRGESSTNH